MDFHHGAMARVADAIFIEFILWLDAPLYPRARHRGEFDWNAISISLRVDGGKPAISSQRGNLDENWKIGKCDDANRRRGARESEGNFQGAVMAESSRLSRNLPPRDEVS